MDTIFMNSENSETPKLHVLVLKLTNKLDLRSRKNIIDRIYVKGYGFLSFAKNMGKSLSNKYGQKLLDSAKKSTTDAIKTASKRAIQKTAEATGDLIGNKIADKITSVSKKKSDKELHNNNYEDVEITTHKKRYISTEEREQIIEELRIHIF